jgi:hypothetical protein
MRYLLAVLTIVALAFAVGQVFASAGMFVAIVGGILIAWSRYRANAEPPRF